MDEATSNVDTDTDHLIQQCIRREFANSTIITIAHRLTTIADYDWIVVMDKGKVREQGSPSELLRKNGMFAEMVRKLESKPRSLLRRPTKND